MAQLTTTDLDEFRHRLATERRALQQGARDELQRARTESYSTLAGDSPDFGDQAVATSLVDYDNAMARRHIAALQEIDAALARLEEGGFGRCAVCQEVIDRDRLAAFPAARRCAECQAYHEHTYAHGDTPSL